VSGEYRRLTKCLKVRDHEIHVIGKVHLVAPSLGRFEAGQGDRLRAYPAAGQGLNDRPPDPCTEPVSGQKKKGTHRGRGPTIG